MGRGTAEARVLDAVLLVLAATGCQPGPASEPVQPQPSRGSGAPDPWATSSAPPGDAGVTQVTIAPPPPPPAPSAEEIAKASSICERYKRTQKLVKVPPRPTTQPTQQDGVRELATWDVSSQRARCTIVREKVDAQFKVWVTPGETRCCPPADCSQHHSPKPYEHTVQGTYTLVEVADVAADATLVASSARWAPQWHEMQPIPLSQQPYCGRRPEGLAFDGESSSPSTIGALLAASAELEAASVPAFERLARELEAHGAPRELVRRARAAMRDEIRHARTMTRLAARHGASPRAAEVKAMPVRSLEEIARENAVEGCVHEAFGALVASYQAERAEPALRRAFAAIARDERSHVALAEAIHDWCIATLDAASRDELKRARMDAVASLRECLDAHVACDELGVPGPEEARALCDAYFRGQIAN